MAVTLAYGEYGSTEYWAMFAQTLPFVVRVVLLVLVVYVAASAAAEAGPWRWVGLPIYIAGLAFMAPQFAVMGAWGPAHVGMVVGLWSVPLLGTALLGKIVLLYMGRWPKTVLR